MFIFFILILLGMNATLAQTITGTVTDSDSEPIPGVSILAKGTTVGVITDLNGNYSINVPTEATSLIFHLLE